jgi:hypothetical protein
MSKKTQPKFGIFSKERKQFLNFSTTPRWTSAAKDKFTKVRCSSIIQKLNMKNCVAKKAE